MEATADIVPGRKDGHDVQSIRAPGLPLEKARVLRAPAISRD
jgi:hypothetical protein